MISIIDIQRAVAAEWGVSMVDLLSRRRRPGDVLPRQAAYLIARNMTRASLPTIARKFLKDNHTTVWHGIRAARHRMADQPDYAAKVSAVEYALLDRVRHDYSDFAVNG